ncbi:hypothetical protein AJ79_08047 [Helicocarpus griseus UAMH5409]|uniref:Rhodopsin domain-containing protein n=1 Tax=Helicocarpus griseus UAMH5409 TaxID=1447875 RepID=A0A2B7WWM9_9EURO|nr:hypothetical protein AJ79_08047 [Helicocarpus griseus UAMH5409]
MDTADPTLKHDRGPELIAVSTFLTFFGTAFVCTRLWVRYTSIRSFGWDDLFLFLSMLAGLAGQGLTYAGAAHGDGKPFLTVDKADVVQSMKYTNFGVFCNGLGMAFLKVGIGCSLLRIDLSRVFNIIVIMCMVLSLLVNLTVFGGTFGACTPIEKIWNKDPELPGNCWPKEASLVMSYVQTVGNIATDLAFSIGPLVYLSRVKVSRYNKWALRGVFLIGLTATACAIAKATELPVLTKSTDPTYDAVDLVIWVKAEFNAGLFAASLPPLKSTFEKILRKMGITTGHTTPANTYGGYGGGRRSRYGEYSSRSRGHASMGFNLTNDNETRGRTAYVMHDVSRSSPSGAESMEEDQKHILESDGNGGYITKTTEYSVSRVTLESHR